MTEAHISVMFKKVCVIALLILQSVVFFSCSKDEPVNPENTETPTTPPESDDDTTGDDDDTEDADINVVITENTASNGAQFSRIDETTFMLDYVKYQIVEKHIEVIGADDAGIGDNLNGKVTIYGTITIDGSTYLVRSIADEAFMDCKKVKEVTMPNTVLLIGVNAFCSCRNLCSIQLSESLKTISDLAFRYTPSLKTIVIPNSVTKIGSCAFYSCGLVSVTLPEGLTEIAEGTFVCSTSLSSIIIPETVTSIGESAFDGCESLAHIVIPKNVITIGKETFWGCKNLTHIVIPEKVSTIERSAFGNCLNLKVVICGKGLRNIGDCAFKNCMSLKSMYFLGSVPSVSKGSFEIYSDNSMFITEWERTAYVLVQNYGGYGSYFLESFTSSDYLDGLNGVVKVFDPESDPTYLDYMSDYGNE